ncbi:MAG: hypothetical protein U0796_16970 [Gemmatales bacterium]
MHNGTVAYSYQVPGYNLLSGQRPEDDPATVLVVNRSFQGNHAFTLINPLRQSQNILFPLLPGLGNCLSPNNEYYGRFSALSLSHLHQLQATSFVDALTIVMENWLSAENYKPLQQLALLRVYRSRDQALLYEQAVPSFFIHMGYSLLLNEGKYLLYAPRFTSGRLGNTLLHQYATQEGKDRIARAMPGLTLFSCVTGKVVKEWPEIKSPDVRWIDREHLLVHTNYHDPADLWASSRQSRNLRSRILNTRTLEILDLPVPITFMEVHVVPYGEDWSVLASDYPDNENVGYKTLMIISRKGEVRRRYEFRDKMRNLEFMLIPHQDQVIKAEMREALLPQWYNWVNKYPWLKHVPLGARSNFSVLDLASGQKVLRLEENQNWHASLDGKYLITGASNEPQVELRCYDMPISPLASWALWLPRVAGVTPLFLWLVYLFRSRKMASYPVGQASNS